MEAATTSTVIRGGESERLEMPGMGSIAFVSDGPELISAELFIRPGEAFNFHRHPDQHESIYVIEGEIETWNDQEKLTLKGGDAVSFAPGAVHAMFNDGDEVVKLFVALGPFLADEEGGWVMTDLSEEEPYASLR